MTARPPSVVVTCEVPGDRPLERSRSRSLARSMGLAWVEPGKPGGTADLTLVLHNGGLSLRDNRHPRSRLLRADFEGAETASKKQPLGRAVGRRTRTIVDATAGWGEDARRLCAMGLTVTAVERNPVMSALLEDAASRAREAGRADVPRVVAADAIEYLAAHPQHWDCVYLDPMFPPKPRASTLSRRPLRLLRELTGDDPDKHALFAAAITAGRRIVVKRPDYSGPVFGAPAQVVAGKLVCYDVYFPV